jgi:hypothetical protein
MNIYQQSSAVGGFSNFGMTSASGRANVASSQLSTYNRIANIGKLNKITKANGSGQRTNPVATSSLQNSQHLKGKFYQTQVLKKMGSTAESNNIMAQGSKAKNQMQQHEVPEIVGLMAENNSYSNQTYQNKNKATDGPGYLNRPVNNSSQLSVQ